MAPFKSMFEISLAACYLFLFQKKKFMKHANKLKKQIKATTTNVGVFLNRHSSVNQAVCYCAVLFVLLYVVKTQV